MALVQSSLLEDILSRQERAVIRGIYRASQLTEALTQLKKVQDSISLTSGSAVSAKPMIITIENVPELEAYLRMSIKKALVSTKVPANTSENSTQPEVKTPN